MESVQTLSLRYTENMIPALTRSVEHKPGLLVLLFRYALPFLLFDMIAVGIASFLYFGLRFFYVFSGMEFFLYGFSMILLAGLHKGLRFRHFRRFIVLYIAFILFSLTGLALAVLLRFLKSMGAEADVLQWIFWRLLLPAIMESGMLPRLPIFSCFLCSILG